MEITRLITGPIDVNTYIVPGKNKGECFIVDPSDTEWVVRSLNEQGLTPTHILLTHGHFDHILAVAELREKYGLKVAIHKKDLDMLENPDKYMLFGGYHVKPSKADILLEGGEVLSIAGRDVEVLHTPGHTPGGVCYALRSERALFTGDTLFLESVGRTDFPGGSMEELIDSILLKLFTLEGDYTVYPGHMGKTSLAHERLSNPYAGERGEAW